MDMSKGCRSDVVEKVSVEHFDVDNVLHPFRDKETGRAEHDVWAVWVVSRLGLLPSTTYCEVFHTEDAARTFEKELKLNEEKPRLSADSAFPEARAFIANLMALGKKGRSVLCAGDDGLYLAWSVLEQTDDVTDDKALTEFLGPHRIAFHKNAYKENWLIAAQFEFCWLKYPDSSPAYIAAACRYHYFISEDEFSAGYLLRDLECLVLGVEAEAAKAQKDAARRAKAAGARSAGDRSARIASLIEKIEELTTANPALRRMDPKAVAKVAAEDAAKDAPSIWAQGRGQVDEYLGEVRRGEAGEELRAIYQRIFAKPL